MKTSKQFLALIFFIALLNSLTVNAQEIKHFSRVGIGEAVNPDYMLDVRGTSGAVLLHPNFGAENKAVVNATFIGSPSVNALGAQIRFQPWYTSTEFIDVGQDSLGNFAVEANNEHKFVVSRQGNVGIGINNPDARITLPNASNIKLQDPQVPTWGTILRNDANGDGFLTTAGHNLTLGTGWGQELNLVGGSSIRLGTNGGDANVETQMTIKSNGKVGIGTVNPATTLDVNGTVKTKDAQIDGNIWLQPNKAIYVNYKSFFTTHNRKFIEFTTDYQGNNARGTVNFYAPTNYYSNVPALTLIGNYGAGGTVGIGTDVVPAGYRLAVDGKLICEEVKVQLSENWPDYVFENDYELMPLNEVADYIATEKHLPGIPAAAEIDGEGVEMGEMQRKMMEKIEELTLYMIDLKKENDVLKAKVNKLESLK